MPLSRSYYWKPVTQEEAVLLDLPAEESPAQAGPGCFSLIQILHPVLTHATQRFRRGYSDASLALAIGRQLWNLIVETPADISGGASQSIWDRRAAAAEAAQVTCPGFSQACWKSCM